MIHRCGLQHLTQSQSPECQNGKQMCMVGMSRSDSGTDVGVAGLLEMTWGGLGSPSVPGSGEPSVGSAWLEVTLDCEQIRVRVLLFRPIRRVRGLDAARLGIHRD